SCPVIERIACMYIFAYATLFRYEFEAGEEIVVERPYDEWNVSIHYELELKKDHTYGKESTYQIELPELLQADTDQESAEVTAERSEEHTSELQSRFDILCRLHRE